jgi:hypothetical protein
MITTIATNTITQQVIFLYATTTTTSLLHLLLSSFFFFFFFSSFLFLQSKQLPPLTFKCEHQLRPTKITGRDLRCDVAQIADNGADTKAGFLRFLHLVHGVGRVVRMCVQVLMVVVPALCTTVLLCETLRVQTLGARKLENARCFVSLHLLTECPPTPTLI